MRLLRGAGLPGRPGCCRWRVASPGSPPRAARAPRWCSPASTWGAWGRDLRPRATLADLVRAAAATRASSIALPASPRSSRWSSRSGSSTRRPGPSSASTSTSRCRAGPTGCSRRCAVPTARPGTPASSRRWPGRARARRSAPTSWWAFRARPRTITAPPWRSSSVSCSHTCTSSPSLPVREPRPRRWKGGFPGRPSRPDCGNSGNARPGDGAHSRTACAGASWRWWWSASGTASAAGPPGSTPRSASLPAEPGGARRRSYAPGYGVRLGSKVARAAASS